MRTEWEGSCLQPKEQGFPRNQPCPPLDLSLSSLQNSEKIPFRCLRPSPPLPLSDAVCRCRCASRLFSPRCLSSALKKIASLESSILSKALTRGLYLLATVVSSPQTWLLRPSLSKPHRALGSSRHTHQNDL